MTATIAATRSLSVIRPDWPALSAGLVDKCGGQIELIRCYRNAIYARADSEANASTRYRLTSAFTAVTALVSLSDHPYRWFFSRPDHQLQLIDLWNLPPRSSVTRWNVNRGDKRGYTRGTMGSVGHWLVDISWPSLRSLYTLDLWFESSTRTFGNLRDSPNQLHISYARKGDEVWRNEFWLEFQSRKFLSITLQGCKFRNCKFVQGGYWETEGRILLAD